MVDIVLVRPGMIHKAEEYWSHSLPLGIGYLAAVLRKNKYSVRIVDGKLLQHSTIQQTVDEILRYSPRFVGFSTMTVDFPIAVEIASLVKARIQNSIILFGGPHINALPLESMKEADCIDIAITGQAEERLCQTLADNANGRTKSDLDGVYVREGDLISGRPCVVETDKDLTEIPFPAWDLFPQTHIFPMMTERGCPYQCVFCSHNMSHRIRSRPIEHVMDEVRWLYRQYDAKHISFEDDTFGMNEERTIDLLENLVRFNERANIQYGAQTRVDCFSLEMAQLMKKANFDYVSLGVESGDPDVLERTGKNITIDQIYRAVEIARKAQMKVWLKFILGLPGESRKSVKNTINLATKLNPDKFSAAIIVAYPGSDVYRWATNGEYGYRLLTHDWSSFDKYLDSSVELDSLTSRQLKRYQIQMVFEVYFRNSRYKELLSVIKNNQNALFLAIKNCIKAT